MLEIEIFSDAICPWCFIGKRRLDTALKQLGADGDDIRLRWRPYMLYPNLPPEGVDRAELLRARYGPRGDKGRVPGTILTEAQAEDIALRYDLIQRTPNTRAAHRLVEWVYQHRGWRQQRDLVEDLFLAYFCAGRDVGDSSVLSAIAAPFDLDTQAQKAVFGGQGEVGAALEAEVDAQLQRAMDLGVSGVPGYVMGGGYLLPGAQSVETMQAIILRAQTKFASA